MPFDGFPSDYEVKKPDVFSLEGLIAWLETQDPVTKYEFMDCNGACLLGQYMAANGLPWNTKDYVRLAFRIAPKVAVNLPRTFGGALKRARSLATQGRE